MYHAHLGLPVFFVEGELTCLMEAKCQVHQLLLAPYFADPEEYLTGYPEKVASNDVLAGELKAEAIAT